MEAVSYNSERLHLTVSVPPAVARLARAVRGRASRPTSRLVFANEIPTAKITVRDVSSALEPFDSATKATVAKPSVEQENDNLAAAVARLWWYHTIDLPGGVTTPGVLDHRPLLPHYGLPIYLDGKRALDVGTCDGFWAFEMERRGAVVTAADVGRFAEYDFPPAVRDALIDRNIDRDTGAAFACAKRALSSGVTRIERSVYDLAAEDIGTYDFVHAGDLLLHLEDPIRALRAIRNVTNGTALLVDCVDPKLPSGTTRYLGGWSSVTWWTPSIDALVQMISDAGFAHVRIHTMYQLSASRGPTGGPWRIAVLAST